jgi:hypothetical protein
VNESAESAPAVVNVPGVSCTFAVIETTSLITPKSGCRAVVAVATSGWKTPSPTPMPVSAFWSGVTTAGSKLLVSAFTIGSRRSPTGIAPSAVVPLASTTGGVEPEAPRKPPTVPVMTASIEARSRCVPMIGTVTPASAVRCSVSVALLMALLIAVTSSAGSWFSALLIESSSAAWITGPSSSSVFGARSFRV